MTNAAPAFPTNPSPVRIYGHFNTKSRITKPARKEAALAR